MSRGRRESCFYQCATSNPPADQREQCNRKMSSCGGRYAEAGGSSTYESYVQPWAFPSFPSGAELRSGGWQEEEGHCGLQGQHEERFGPRASERSREWGFDIPRVSSDPREETENWLAFQARRPVRARQPSSWAPAVCSDQSRGQGLHVRTSCREQPATRTDRGWASIAAVVSGRKGPQQSSGPHKPHSKGSDHFEPTALSEATTRLMSLADISGPLCGMPDGTTRNEKVVTNCIATAEERQNKTPIYVSGVTDTRGFQTWIRASCHKGLSAQIKGERLMLVQRLADGFRATVSAMRSLDGSKGVGFHTFSLAEDRCLRLLSKNLRTSSERSWGLGYLCPGSLAVPLRAPWPGSLQGQNPNPALHCVGSAGTWGGETAPCSAIPANFSAICRATADTHPGVLFVVGLTSQESALSLHFRARLRPQLAFWLVRWLIPS